ncbi:MAG: hypothetical protein DDT29_02480 [Dehalococcoidia bacterium]|nr:hypothetical protein [Bacillota bacterium]
MKNFLQNNKQIFSIIAGVGFLFAVILLANKIPNFLEFNTEVQR